MEMYFIYFNTQKFLWSFEISDFIAIVFVIKPLFSWRNSYGENNFDNVRTFIFNGSTTSKHILFWHIISHTTNTDFTRLSHASRILLNTHIFKAQADDACMYVLWLMYCTYSYRGMNRVKSVFAVWQLYCSSKRKLCDKMWFLDKNECFLT